MRDQMMSEVLKNYDQWQESQQDKEVSFKKKKGPFCTRCSSPLKKRKPANGTAFYECRRHGFVRNVLN